jgi:hypothetical protein
MAGIRAPDLKVREGTTDGSTPYADMDRAFGEDGLNGLEQT